MSETQGSEPIADERVRFIHMGERPLSPTLFVSTVPEDGYELTFANLAEFEAWRRQEEETHTVEFVKGDTHSSRTNPPRFKEHTKLVCARHSRRGRKQYVKKHPERTRKTPSRKIDGAGCPASICFKTYMDTEVVRVMYNREHSHPIGLENLPFTRKGQKALSTSRLKSIHRIPATSVTSTSEDESQASSIQSPVVDAHTPHLTMSHTLTNPPRSLPPASERARSEVGNDIVSPNLAPVRQLSAPDSGSRSIYIGHQPPHDYQSPHIHTSRLEPSSPLHTLHDSPAVYDPPPGLPLRLPDVPTVHDRWERLAVLFRSVHTHALTFHYPNESVDALESMLVQLYLESPLVESTLRQGSTGLGMEEIDMGALGDTELGISGIGGSGMSQLPTMGMMENAGIGIPQQPHLHMQPHPHHNLRPH